MEVINVKNTRIKRDNVIYIGRKNATWNLPESKWANPYAMTSEGDRDMVIELYEKYLRGTPYLWDSLEELDGKTLACWCHPKKCHGDVIIECLNEKKLGSIMLPL